MADTILTETVDGVRVISYNRPDRHNAIDDATGDAFRVAFEDAVRDQVVRAILLRGEGKSFCSGRDTSVLGHREREESDFEFVRRHQDGRLAMQDCPKPIVAALKGAVIGGGCEAALCADMRVSDDSLKMALPEIHYGLLPDTGGTQLLTALIGPSRAKYLILTGERIGSATAYDWGAIDFVVPAEDLDGFAMALARKLASKPPIALAMGKQWGLVPGWGLSQRLPRRVGPTKALEMMLTCRPYSGEEALAMGLVNECVPDDELDAKVVELCRLILANSWHSNAENKKLVYATDGMRLSEGLDHELMRNAGFDKAMHIERRSIREARD